MGCIKARVVARLDSGHATSQLRVRLEVSARPRLPSRPVADTPELDLNLTSLDGSSRPLREWLTTFHLAIVALDPFTNESAWILPTAAKVLSTFQEADCRIAWLVTGSDKECKMFLGPWAREILTFADPDRTAVKGLGLDQLPAIVTVAMDGSILAKAEGWRPSEWRSVVERLASVTAWKAPVVPAPGDPGPFEGTPVAG